ncbi:hypothetical protein Golob_003468, partial [Gossypium lobatum]|nr:hypothetical protein [Gossypium lobatum]
LDYLIGWRAVAVKQLSIASNWGKSKFIAEDLTGRFPASENNDNHNRNRISSSPGAAPILSPVNVSDFSDITEGR